MILYGYFLLQKSESKFWKLMRRDFFRNIRLKVDWKKGGLPEKCIFAVQYLEYLEFWICKPLFFCLQLSFTKWIFLLISTHAYKKSYILLSNDNIRYNYTNYFGSKRYNLKKAKFFKKIFFTVKVFFSWYIEDYFWKLLLSKYFIIC